MNPKRKPDHHVRRAKQDPVVEYVRRRMQKDPDVGATVGESPDRIIAATPKGPVRA